MIEVLRSPILKHGNATNGGAPVAGLFVYSVALECWRCAKVSRRCVRAPSAPTAAAMFRQLSKEGCERCYGLKRGLPRAN
jgi:hypothetical protein